MLPNIEKLKALPPSILHEIAENLHDLGRDLIALASKSEFDTAAQIAQFQRHNDLRACCDAINVELDRGTDLDPAISRVYQKNGSNHFTLSDLRWFWINVGSKTRPKRQKVARERQVMVLYRAGLSDKAIAAHMRSKSPAWSNIHEKTIGKIKREALARMSRGLPR